MKLKFFSFLFFLSVTAYSQPGVKSLSFIPILNGEILELEKKYYVSGLDDSISFDRIKFYLSDFQFYKGEEKVLEVPKRHILLDVENPSSLSMALAADPFLSFDNIRFNLGIDSLTSVSGAFGGDLDPTNGMYWSWQSGYINVKIEGKADKCPARKNKFQFHLGGYAHPNNCLQKVELAVEDKEEIIISLDLNKFFQQIDLAQTYQLMSPGPEAVQLSSQVSKIFYVQDKK